MFEVEKNPHYRDERVDTAAPFHADEQVKLGKSVHVIGWNGDGRCLSARISGHFGHFGSTSEEDWVYLAIDYPPNVMHETGDGSYARWRPREGEQRPSRGTWHWPRACPDGL